MKILSLLAAMAWLPLSLPAALLNTVPVDEDAINCVFSLDCTNRVLDSSSPIKLPGTSGIGYLQTRVVKGEDQSSASGLFGYQYRIDLSAVQMNPNREPCFTNVARCFTNRVVMETNLVVCRTNGLSCVTNLFPATNFVLCLTNEIPAQDILQCITNAAGDTVCITNSFPATNVVVCITNRLPRRITITCSTNANAPLDITCVTNRVRWVTNLVTCETNLIPCPRTTPCIETVTIDFGRLGTNVDFNSDGITNDHAYVVTSTNQAALAPDQIVQADGKITLRFSPPICPGDSSAFVGFLSERLPDDKKAKLTLTSGGSLSVSALVPGKKRHAQNCDFSDLLKEIKDLKNNDLIGGTRRQREEHQQALLRYAKAAKAAAEQSDMDGVANALAGIITRMDGGDDDWITSNGGRQIRKALDDLRDCLSNAFDQDDNDDDNDDDDDNGDHGHGHGHN